MRDATAPHAAEEVCGRLEIVYEDVTARLDEPRVAKPPGVAEEDICVNCRGR